MQRQRLADTRTAWVDVALFSARTWLDLRSASAVDYFAMCRGSVVPGRARGFGRRRALPLSLETWTPAAISALCPPPIAPANVCKAGLQPGILGRVWGAGLGLRCAKLGFCLGCLNQLSSLPTLSSIPLPFMSKGARAP